MRVLFLDNDGVICLSNNWGSRLSKWSEWRRMHQDNDIKNLDVFHRFDNFDKKAITVLNEIITETGCELVVSSDWRYHATLDELGDYYESQGIIKRPIGVTEVIKIKSWTESGDVPEDFVWDDKLDLEQHRSFEILKWLKDHPEVTSWVSVDDLDLSKRFKWGLDNFVLTPKAREGIKQSGVKDKIIKFLNK